MHAEAQTLPEPSANTCSTCRVDLSGRAAYFVRARGALHLECGRCSLINRDLMRRSAVIAAIVGTGLVALNQGDLLLSGDFPWATNWYKLPLTYFVPFCVATYGALSNGYRAPESA